MSIKWKWGRIVIAGVLVGLLLCLSACSDAILNPDGSISYAGTMTLAGEQPTAGGDTSSTTPAEPTAGTTNDILTLAPQPTASESEPETNMETETETEPETETETETASTLVIRPSGDLSGDPFPNAEHTLYADFLDTGKSDCILLRMDDKVILVDTGEKDDATRIKQTLDGYGITHIDYLIFTHFDNDHIGSAETVLGQYTVGEVYMPDYVRDSKLYRKLNSALTRAAGQGTTVHRLYAQDVELDLDYGQIWINATGLSGYEPGQTLGADEDNVDTDENNFSLITAVTFGDQTMILCGDAEGERMAEYLPLATSRGITSCTLLKIPHHGSSADKGLLDAVRAWKPRYCVVCVDDAQNVIGAIVTNMKSVGAGRYYTSDGCVSFSTDGTGALVTQE